MQASSSKFGPTRVNRQVQQTSSSAPRSESPPVVKGKDCFGVFEWWLDQYAEKLTPTPNQQGICLDVPDDRALALVKILATSPHSRCGNRKRSLRPFEC